jgi:hypothetical protein
MWPRSRLVNAAWQALALDQDLNDSTTDRHRIAAQRSAPSSLSAALARRGVACCLSLRSTEMPYDKWQNTPGFSAAIAGFKDAVFGAGNYVAFEARRSAHAPPHAVLWRAAHRSSSAHTAGQ